MATYVYEVINPKTNRKIRVGGPVYKQLIKSGDLPEKALVIIDGKPAINAESISQGTQTAFDSKEAKIKALREYKSQLEDKKKVTKKEVKTQEALEQMKKLYIDERAKRKELKQQVKTKRPKATKPPVKPKKEEHYEYDSGSKSGSDASGASSASSSS